MPKRKKRPDRAYPGDRIYFVREVAFVPGNGKAYTGWVRECEWMRNGRLGALLLPIEGDTLKLNKPRATQEGLPWRRTRRDKRSDQ